MSEIYSELENIRHSMNITQYENELNHLLDIGSENTDRIKELQNKINDINTTNVNNKINAIETKNNTQTIKQIYGQINKLIFLKPWNKLPDIHKIIKIKEYSLKLSDEKELTELQHTKLLNRLIAGIRNKELTKKNMVDYDSKNACIKDIMRLNYDDIEKQFIYK